MALPLVHSLLSWYLKNRKHQIDLFVQHPNDVQYQLLFKLLDFAKDTTLGRAMEFKSIGNYEAFRERVPIKKYEHLEIMINESRMGKQNVFWPTPIKWFAKSSGTTGSKSKFIPVSEEAIEYCHFNAGKDMLCMFFNNNPDSQLFKGKSLRLGGSSAIHENNYSYYGDLSAIIIENMPFWANYSSTPKQEVALMNEWEEKMEAIVNETMNQDITSLAGVPSWMLVLLNKILEAKKKSNLLDIWPNLEVYFHGGVHFSPYMDQYKKLIPSSNFQYYETYNASEGFFAIQDRNDADDMLLMLDYGIFYEFIPMENFDEEFSKAIPLEEVELNKNYAIVITTNAGLWRYLIGDTVKFTSLNPFRIKITGRTKHYINAFGEEMIIENVEEAIKRASKQTETKVTDFTVAPIYMDGKEKGRHEWFIACKQLPISKEVFIDVLDTTLKEVNSDYEAKRYKDFTLKKPLVHFSTDNTFYHWLKSNEKLGGQHKVPRLSNNRKFMDELLAINQKLVC